MKSKLSAIDELFMRMRAGTNTVPARAEECAKIFLHSEKKKTTLASGFLFGFEASSDYRRLAVFFAAFFATFFTAFFATFFTAFLAAFFAFFAAMLVGERNNYL